MTVKEWAIVFFALKELARISSMGDILSLSHCWWPILLRNLLRISCPIVCRSVVFTGEPKRHTKQNRLYHIYTPNIYIPSNIPNLHNNFCSDNNPSLRTFASECLQLNKITRVLRLQTSNEGFQKIGKKAIKQRKARRLSLNLLGYFRFNLVISLFSINPSHLLSA